MSVKDLCIDVLSIENSPIKAEQIIKKAALHRILVFLWYPATAMFGIALVRFICFQSVKTSLF